MRKCYRVIASVLGIVLLVVLSSPWVSAAANDFDDIQDKINAILDNGTSYVIEGSITLKSSDGTDKYI